MDINGIQKLNQIDPKKLKADPGIEKKSENKPNSLFGNGFSKDTTIEGSKEFSYTGSLDYEGTVSDTGMVDYAGSAAFATEIDKDGGFSKDTNIDGPNNFSESGNVATGVSAQNTNDPDIGMVDYLTDYASSYDTNSVPPEEPAVRDTVIIDKEDIPEE